MIFCEKIKSALADWELLHSIEEMDGIVKIVTQATDGHNDLITIYAEDVGDRVMLTDDRYTFDDLELCGINLESELFKTYLQTIATTFNHPGDMTGVDVKIVNDCNRYSNNGIYVSCWPGHIKRAAQSLLKAIKRVDAIYDKMTEKENNNK